MSRQYAQNGLYITFKINTLILSPDCYELFPYQISLNIKSIWVKLSFFFDIKHSHRKNFKIWRRGMTLSRLTLRAVTRNQSFSSTTREAQFSRKYAFFWVKLTFENNFLQNIYKLILFKARNTGITNKCY